MEFLTPKQSEALSVIISGKTSLGEIAKAMGLRSPSSAQRHVDALVGKGYLERQAYVTCGLTLTEKACKLAGIKFQHLCNCEFCPKAIK